MWEVEGSEVSEGCEHEWKSVGERATGRRDQDRNTRHTDGRNPETQGSVGAPQQTASQGDFCTLCGAWRGALGLKPDPSLYVSHLVAVFREVKRVLHPTGVCWVNLGSSYAASRGYQVYTEKRGHSSEGLTADLPSGYKATDLVNIPALVAEALREDGWYLRKIMPWVKPTSAMPESVTSRPGSAIEWWLMLTKQPGGKAFWDGEMVRSIPISHSVKTTPQSVSKTTGYLSGNRSDPSRSGAVNTHPSGRAFRDADLFMASLDDLIAEQRAYLAHLESCRGKDGGLLLDEDGEPLALLVNPKGFSGTKYIGDWSRKEWRPCEPNDPEKGSRRVEVWYIASPECEAHAHYHRADKWERLGYADGRVQEARAGDVDGAKCACLEVKVDHFAVFSERLIEPLIRASCPREVCKKCNAPKVREVQREASVPQRENYHATPDAVLRNDIDRVGGWYPEPGKTLGFSPSCDCGKAEGAEFLPGTVLDCFAGACTTLVVARRLGLRGIAIDTSRDYLVMGAGRLQETGPSREHAAAEKAGQLVLPEATR